MTPSGIDPATFWFVAQCLNHCATAYPLLHRKFKIHLITCSEGTEWEHMCSYTFALTSVLDGDGWSTPRPDHFIPVVETRYILYRRLGGSQGRSERMRKISPLPPLWFEPQNVQPVANRGISKAHVENTGCI
jgi:hypothetical protein